MVKCFAFAFAALLTLGANMANAQSLSPSTKWHWEEGTIVVDTPERPAGQKDVINLTTPKIQTVRVGFVGLGMRGPGAVERWTHIPGVQIVALCDYQPERAEACQKYLKQAGLAPAAIYSGAEGYKELCKRNDIDIVYVATDWDHHFPVAKFAMENGKHTAIEVPSAMNLEQCWDLIDLSEKTRKHCMILENCCYDWFEMNTLNMAQHGVFGEVIRAQGAYIHNLDDFWGYYWQNPNGSDKENLHWRMKYNKENRGDVYATHGLGPVAQVLDIHRGDRMKTLVAMDTKSVHGKAYVEKKTGKPCNDFRNGDHSQLASAGHQPKVDNLSSHSFMPESEKQALEKQYQHPILKKYGEMAKEVGGHGGMDFIMDSRLVYCLHNGLPLDMDVYDLAEWCSLAELGALSMDHNCASVAIPDFTRGHWNDVKGFRHAFASAEQEKAVETKASAVTAAQKAATAKFNLWKLYDDVKAAKDEASKKKAEAAYAKAVAKAQAQVAKAEKSKK